VEACEGGWTSYCCLDDRGGGACVDLTTPESCGACGHPCRTGEACLLESEEEGPHCLCEDEGARCEDSSCWRCCPDGRGCVDVCNDATACGGCERDCTVGDRPAGDLCVAGECYCGAAGVVCPGETWCTDVTDPPGCGCVDLTSDPDNCGRCGVACPAGRHCCYDGCSECCDDGDCTGSHHCCSGVCCNKSDPCVPGGCG